MENEDWLTIEEVSIILRVGKEEVMNMFVHGINNSGPTLNPSVYFKEPVTLKNLTQYSKDCKTGKVHPLDTHIYDMKLSGLFKIKDFVKVSSKIDQNSIFLDLSFIPLCRGEDVFIVATSGTLLKSDLIVAKNDFEIFIAFYNIIGQKNIPRLNKIITDEETPQIPEEYVNSLRKQGKTDCEIALFLKNKFTPKITLHNLMKLIDYNRVKKWEESDPKIGRPKEWFNYLVNKAKKNKI